MKKLEELQMKTVEQAKTIDLMPEDISNFMTEKKTFARSNEESSARSSQLESEKEALQKQYEELQANFEKLSSELP